MASATLYVISGLAGSGQPYVFSPPTGELKINEPVGRVLRPSIPPQVNSVVNSVTEFSVAFLTDFARIVSFLVVFHVLWC